MNQITIEEIFRVLRELYPRDLDHAISEARARKAEARLAELEAEQSGGEEA